jgi:hypothetical protein
MYELTPATDSFPDNMVEHTFPRAVFLKTYSLGKDGRVNKRSGALVKTKAPLDLAILQMLTVQCLAQKDDDDDAEEEEEEEEDEYGGGDVSDVP